MMNDDKIDNTTLIISILHIVFSDVAHPELVAFLVFNDSLLNKKFKLGIIRPYPIITCGEGVETRHIHFYISAYLVLLSFLLSSSR
jgi:hypothetical protein